jgi:hypothetical protein
MAAQVTRNQLIHRIIAGGLRSAVRVDHQKPD